MTYVSRAGQRICKGAENDVSARSGTMSISADHNAAELDDDAHDIAA